MCESEAVLPVLPPGRFTLKSFFHSEYGSSQEGGATAPAGYPALGVFPKPPLDVFQLVQNDPSVHRHLDNH